MSTAAIPSPAVSRGPFRLAVAVLVTMAVTILLGAMTTSTGSGLAYRDWPFSDGQLMPESSYRTLPGFFEHFHRIAAGSTGLLALVLACWLQHFSPNATTAARRTAWLGGIAILLQGVVGGVGVLMKLPWYTSIAHAILAQLALATFAALAYQLTERYRITTPVPGVAPGTGLRAALFGVGALVVQTVLGAIARHTNSPHAVWTHAGNAMVVFFLVTIAVAIAGSRLATAPGIRPVARSIVVILIAQIALGFVALGMRNPSGKQPGNVERLGAAATISSHVVLGALLTVLMATLAAHVHRATRRAGA